jgi:hypothetical protein
MPVDEAEQYCTGLTIAGVPTALVKVPQVGHGSIPIGHLDNGILQHGNV